ncbi:MAG: type II and III secretion system protein [Xenococcaceae cyanobacterium]
MTFSGQFVSEEDQEFGEIADYPTAFGITLTPMVSGIICGIIGVFGAAYILMNMVWPALEEYRDLKINKGKEEARLEGLETGETEKKLENLRTKLKKAQALKPQVLALFSNEKTLDTLLIDINGFIESRKAELISYKPEAEKSTVIKDGSLGKLVNGKLKRKRLKLEIEGTFEQTQLILRDIERLQPLLLIKDYRSEVSEKPILFLEFNQAKNKVEVSLLGQTKLKTTFTLDAILPLNQRELTQAEPPKKEGS